MVTLGITGGIGSGKSIVSKILRLKKIPVYDADTEAKRIMVEDPLVVEGLIGLLGTSVITSDGELDRKYIAGKIFGNSVLLEAVNHLVHPAVGRDFARWADEQQKRGASLVAFESAILFEANMRGVLNKVLLVTAPEEVRVERVVARDGVTVEQVRARMNHQMGEEKKKLLSDFVIYNDGGHAVLPQINKMLAQL